MDYVLSFIKIRHQPMGGQVCLTMPANVFAEGTYQRIDLELGKTHDEYEKQINEYIKF
jgi:hypothetical protein